MSLHDTLSGISSLTDFLGGPGRNRSDIAIHEEIDISLPEILYDMWWELEIDPGCQEACQEWLRGISAGAEILKCENGVSVIPFGQPGNFRAAGAVAILEDGRIVGAYSDAMLAVAENMRGCGIGARLVEAVILHHGRLPAWDHVQPSYSIAGAKTHRAALRNLRAMADREIITVPEMA